MLSWVTLNKNLFELIFYRTDGLSVVQAVVPDHLRKLEALTVLTQSEKVTH